MSPEVQNARRQSFRTAVLLAVLAFLVCLPGTRSAAQAYSFVASLSTRPVTPQSRVEALGLGAKARLSTTQGKKFHGYITSIGDNSFELTDVSSWRTYTFSYSELNEVAGQRLPDPASPPGNRLLREVFSASSKLRFGP